jgi:short-subunit dehydrogenase
MSNTTNKLNTNYTLILGAEGLLGKSLAREVARKKCNLILVSTTNLDLQRFAIQLELKEDVKVEAFKLDLGNQEAVQEFTEHMREIYEIRALINNITCDWSVPHNKCISEIAQEDFITRFRGGAFVTMGLLPQMKELSASYVQHIIPFPFKKDQFDDEMQQSVGKIYAFAKELDEELKDSVVSVSLVHPVPMKSLIREFEVFDGLAGEINSMATQLIAVKAVNGMLRGDRLIIPGFRNKARYYLSRQASTLLRSSQGSLESYLAHSS